MSPRPSTVIVQEGCTVFRIVLALSVLPFAACATAVRTAPFHERPDTVVPGDLRGPMNGTVVDADSGRPIAGALVYASWAFVAGNGLNAPSGHQEYVGMTSASGNYEVPRLALRPKARGARLSDFYLVIYKKGYVGYRSDRRFEDFSTRTEFAQKGHKVELARWRSDFSHVRHLRYLGGGPAIAALTDWELPEAAAELDQGRPRAEGAPRAETKSEDERRLLNAAALLTPEDVKRVTGYAGVLDVGRLGNEPPSEEHDSVHLRARNQPEAYDIALRVWKLSLGDAQSHFGSLLADLPNAAAKDEIGDRSLRAISPDGNILGLAFLDAKKGVVVLLSCGSSQCRSHDNVFVLARIVKERLDLMLGAVP
ncbi:MAG: carboxypeptidase regulatory-like domain-containing protein [Deltaproteobacteria bacterium]|nr:carboxypeptidase regulatory-like domain-containing protein [Deltaproteobacteria bacterium]